MVKQKNNIVMLDELMIASCLFNQNMIVLNSQLDETESEEQLI